MLDCLQRLSQSFVPISDYHLRESRISQKRLTLFCCAKSLQVRPTLCNRMDCSPPGSSTHGTLQARTLEWVAMPSSRGSCIGSKSLTTGPPGRFPPGKPYFHCLPLSPILTSLSPPMFPGITSRMNYHIFVSENLCLYPGNPN